MCQPFLDIISLSEDKFPDAVELLLPWLKCSSEGDQYSYFRIISDLMKGGRQKNINYLAAFPKDSIRLLGPIITEQAVIYDRKELESFLSNIFDPNIKRMQEYGRLREFVGLD